MTIRTACFVNAFLLCAVFCSAAEKQFSETEDGIIVYTNADLSGNTKQVRLRVIADNIIRVTASPTDTPNEKKSLITVYDHNATPKWSVEEETGQNKIVNCHHHSSCKKRQWCSFFC